MIQVRWFIRMLAAAALLSGFGVVAAAAEDEAEAPAAEGAPEKGHDADKGRIKEILRKMKAGEELTAEERMVMEKARARLGKDPRNGREGRGPAAGPEGLGGPIEGLELVNAVDAVKLQLAQAWMRADKEEKAVEVLERLAGVTEDKTAAGYAHLAMARIYMRRNDRARCDEELKKVTGPAVAGALAMLAGPGGESAARLEELLKAAQEPLAKAMILRRLAAAYVQSGNVEKLADLAERSGKLLSYKEAMAAGEAEAKLGQRPMPGRPAGFGEIPAWIRPGERPGEGEEAGPEARKGAGGPRAGNAEALRKEIKELEQAGMVEEAEALKKQLKTLEEKPARKAAARAPRPGGQPMPAGEEDVF